jgi:hypothetical protein
MAMIATDLKGMLSINIKSRHDSHSDQYSRIFMVKLLLVCTIIMGISWYTDSINCIVPGAHGISGDFVSATCWIQGVYVYKELKSRVDEVAYFGIPKDVDMDGFLEGLPNENLCPVFPRLASEKKEGCRPMHKTFYVQYQYFPFLVAALTLLFYLPYIFFRAVNTDLISLKNTVKGDNPDAEKIAKHYFNSKTNPTRNNIGRVIGNIVVKLFYLLSNVITLVGLDSLLDGEFVGYGNKWIQWSKLDNTMQYDYMGMRDHPKPGNVLLPPFGYCEVHASAKDIKESYANKHKFVCEMNQHILYQYALLVLWFALIFGIIISCIGLILLLVHYAIGVFGLKDHGPTTRRIFKSLSFRELEYLEFVRKRDIGLYGEILDKLKEIMDQNAGENAFPKSNREDAPLYTPNERYPDEEKRPDFDGY